MNKLCFSTLGCTGYTLRQVIELASSYGINGIEFRGLDGIMDNNRIPDFTSAAAQTTSDSLLSRGINPVVLGTSCKFHNATTHVKMLSDGNADAETAARLHIPNIRVFGNNTGDNVSESISNVINGISKLLVYCRGLGVNVLLEVHGDFNRSETLLPVTEALSEYDNFGLIWDVAHSDTAYGDDWLPFYREIFPLIRHVHIKDHIRATVDAPKKLTLPCNGDIPLRDIISRLLSDGYGGYFSLEWERKWVPQLPPIEAALDRFITLFN